MAALHLLKPAPSKRGANSADCKGGVFWGKMSTLSKDAKRFNVRTQGFLPELHAFSFCAPHEQQALAHRYPFLSLHSKNRSGNLCLDTLEFYLFCLCYTLVETTAGASNGTNHAYGNRQATNGPTVGVSVFVRLLASYMEHLFPNPTSSARTRSASISMKLGNPWSASAHGSEPSDRSVLQQRRDGPGLTFVYLIAELWLHRYAPLRQLGCVSANSESMPPRALLQCVLCVVEHVCKSPFIEITGQAAAVGPPRICEMKEQVRALQRPLFDFLVNCFSKFSELHSEELGAAVDVWIAWVTMGGKMRDNNADHHRRGHRIGAFTRQKADPRALEPVEKQWVAHNYVFFTVLPLHWVGATARVARDIPDIAAKVVEKVLFSLLDNLTIECVDELSTLLCDERSTDPRRSLLVQPQARAFAGAMELMEVTDMPIATFVDLHCGKGRATSTGASREEEYQTERRFRELMRSLRVIFRDEDLEAVTGRLRRLLHIDPESQQEIGVQLTNYMITKTTRNDWGFSCDEGGVIISSDDQQLPVGGRIIRVTVGDRQALPFKSRSELREFLRDASEARFEVQEVSASTYVPCDDGAAWLSNATWASVLPHDHNLSEPPGGSDLAGHSDWCGVKGAIISLNQHASKHPGSLMAAAVSVALGRTVFGATGVISMLVLMMLLFRSAWLSSLFSRSGDPTDCPHGALPRFCFDFSFLFKSAFSTPVVSLLFNMAWVSIFGCLFNWIVASGMLSAVQLLTSCESFPSIDSSVHHLVCEARTKEYTCTLWYAVRLFALLYVLGFQQRRRHLLDAAGEYSC